MKPILLAGACFVMACLTVQADQKPTARVDLYGDPLPEGALARLGTVRYRHGSYGLKTIAFLPDGKTLVGADEERTISFLDAETGRKLREVSTGDLNIRGFALSRDGKRIAVGGFWYPDGGAGQGVIRILDTASGKVLHSFPREPRGMDNCSLAFTPDGKLLVDFGGDGTLRIQEIASGVEILQQKFPADILGGLAVSPDGSLIVVASGPNTRKLFFWKWQAGEEPRELKGLVERPQHPVFSPDGKRMVIVAGYDQTALVVDVESGRAVHRLEAPSDEHFYSAPAYSPDGKTIALFSRGRRQGSIHFWDAGTGQHRARLEAVGGVLVFSPDSRRLVAAGRTISVWDLATMKEIGANDEAHRSSVSAIAVASHGAIVTSSDDGDVRVWDPATSKQKLKLSHGHWVRGMAVSPDGARLASSSLDDTVRLWDFASGKQIFKLAGHGEMGGTRALHFSPDGKRLLSFGDDFYLRVWETRNGKAALEHAIRPTGVKIPDEDSEDSKLDILMGHGQAAFSPDGKLLVKVIGRDFRLFDVVTGKETGTIPTEGGSLISLAFSADSRFLLASSWGASVQTKLPDGSVRHSSAKDHPICWWDLSTRKLVSRVLLPAGGVGPVAFAPDTRSFAVATSAPRNVITIYETASGKERLTLDTVPSRVSALAYTPDGLRLLSGQQDTTVLIWDLTGGK